MSTESPRQERRGPWRWPGPPTPADDRPPLAHRQGVVDYGRRHAVGDGHPGQRGKSRRKNRRRNR